MEIGRVRTGAVTAERKVISEKKDFSQSFSQERQKKSEEQLNKMIDDIKIRMIRKKIQAYMSRIVGRDNIIEDFIMDTFSNEIKDLPHTVQSPVRMSIPVTLFRSG